MNSCIIIFIFYLGINLENIFGKDYIIKLWLSVYSDIYIREKKIWHIIR